MVNKSICSSYQDSGSCSLLMLWKQERTFSIDTTDDVHQIYFTLEQCKNRTIYSLEFKTVSGYPDYGVNLTFFI